MLSFAFGMITVGAFVSIVLPRAVLVVGVSLQLNMRVGLTLLSGEMKASIISGQGS